MLCLHSFLRVLRLYLVFTLLSNVLSTWEGKIGCGSCCLTVVRCKQGIVGGMRRTLLSRRSWGEGDGLCTSRQEMYASAVTTSAATPLRGPMRASADSTTPSQPYRRSGGTHERNETEDVLGSSERGQVRTGVRGRRVHAGEENSADGDCSVEISAAAVVLQRRQFTHDDNGAHDDPDADATPHRRTGASSSTPGKPSCSTPPREIRSSKDSGRGAEGDASTHLQRTPSASVMTGCIRAHQRTPQRSLGPAQRIPLSQRLKQDEPAASARDTPASEVMCSWKESRRSGGHVQKQASWEGCDDSQVLQPQFSGFSPKNASGGRAGMEEDDVETAVADIWALTEGLRRSAQRALNASHSSG